MQIKPNFQCQDQRAKFHGYAIKDRVNYPHILDKPPSYTVPEPGVLIPSLWESLKEDLKFLLLYNGIFLTSILHFFHYTAFLVQHIRCFKDQSKDITSHIPSRHSMQMGLKSEMVSV